MTKMMTAALLLAVALGLTGCCPHGQNCNVASGQDSLQSP